MSWADWDINYDPNTSPITPGAGPTPRFPNPVTLTLRSQTAPGTYADYSIAYCGQTPSVRQETHPSFGVYCKYLCSFWIPKTFTSVAPKTGDLIVDPNSRTWTIRKNSTSRIYYLGVAAIDLDLTYGLADTINAQPPVDSTDGFASPITTVGNTSGWNGLHARIQFKEQKTVFDDQGRSFMRSDYNIWVSGLNANLNIGTTVRATAGEYSGKTFRVQEVLNVDQIEELELLVCTLDP
jgi:hypothetical protein